MGSSGQCSFFPLGSAISGGRSGHLPCVPGMLTWQSRGLSTGPDTLSSALSTRLLSHGRVRHWHQGMKLLFFSQGSRGRDFLVGNSRVFGPNPEIAVSGDGFAVSSSVVSKPGGSWTGVTLKSVILPSGSGGPSRHPVPQPWHLGWSRGKSWSE